MIKNFACFKVGEKKNDSQPDYRLSAKVGDDYVDIGAGWVKEGKSGKFISFKLSDAYKENDGWALVKEGAVKKVEEVKAVAGTAIPYPEAEVDSEIPF